MQALYPNRINWENTPSTNTALGANNLNKMDYALYQLDQRVLTLGGYQESAATSATNAKTSETNAKESELLAKEYADKAFSGTPEGYELLIEDVEKMGLETTSSTTLPNSKAGGLKINSIKGATYQNTTSGKNLLKNTASGKTSNGVTFTIKNDKSIGVSGTSTAAAELTIGQVTLPAGTYKFSGLTGSTTDEMYINFSGVVNVYDGEVEATLSEDMEVTVKIIVQSGYTFSTTIYPMISVEGGDYEPYTNGASPNPDYPQAIQNVGDCVELMVGKYDTDNGIYANSTSDICCKVPIPCKSGDIVKIVGEQSFTTIYMLYYNESGYLSYAVARDTNEGTFTIPSECTFFNIRFHGVSNLDTVGKISLTINDKYVVQVKTVGKNLIKPIGNSGSKSGITFTDNQDGSFTIKGTATGNTSFNITNETITFKEGVSYTLSKNTILGSGGIITASVYNSDGSTTYDFIKDGETKTVNEECTMRSMSVYISSGTTVDCTFAVQLEIGEVSTDFEPYTEKVATILLTEILREDDILYKEKGVWYIDRNRAVHEVYISSINTASNGNTFATVSPSNKAYIATTDKHKCNKAIYSNSMTDGTYRENPANFIFYGTTDDTLESMQEKYNGALLEYKVSTPTIEELDTDSQIALNSLVTFDDVTYIVVDSRVQPSGIESEYGTSKVGGYTLKSLLNSENNAIKISELTIALLELTQE